MEEGDREQERRRVDLPARGGRGLDEKPQQQESLQDRLAVHRLDRREESEIDEERGQDPEPRRVVHGRIEPRGERVEHLTCLRGQPCEESMVVRIGGGCVEQPAARREREKERGPEREPDEESRSGLLGRFLAQKPEGGQRDEREELEAVHSEEPGMGERRSQVEPRHQRQLSQRDPVERESGREPQPLLHGAAREEKAGEGEEHSGVGAKISAADEKKRCRARREEERQPQLQIALSYTR